MIGRRRHPTAAQLALLAGGDLPGWKAFFVRRHLPACQACRDYYEDVERVRMELKREAAAQTLTGFEAIADFVALEREMMGNIAVGLAAARCVETVEPRRRSLRRTAWMTAALGAVFTLAWWTHVPSDETRELVGKLERWAMGEANAAPAGTLMRSLPEGIAVRSQGTTLTMQHPRSAVISATGGGTIEARFVDEETGRVTISSVYAQ